MKESVEEIRKKYSYYNLDEAIQEYAEVIADEIGGDKRIEIHDRICQLIGVDKEKFSPFDDVMIGIGCSISYKTAEYVIKRAIGNAKGG